MNEIFTQENVFKKISFAFILQRGADSQINVKSLKGLLNRKK